MKQRIKVFGLLVDLLGANEIEIDAVQSTDELIVMLHSNYPSLQSKKYFIAIDKKMANTSIQLQPSSEIAIMPPFSGG